ncbi:MAG: ethylbenzene dehydrogenase-related protein [Candidatus Thiodiazotropha sp. 6PDIVS]
MLLLLLSCQPLPAEQILSAVPVSHPPVIDGHTDDDAWSGAPPLLTRDAVADIDIELRACHDGENIYLLAVFPDSKENREHKPLIWNPLTELYDQGFQREDTLVLKWAISPQNTDLSLSASAPYKADIWYWKSVRTDPAGYADDKYQLYSAHKTERSMPLLSKNGTRFYFIRRGDSGTAAYRNQIQLDYAGDHEQAYIIEQPEGSRADIRAKGQWKQGVWQIEFARKLDTGHADDIAFQVGKSYQFGVSRYEIAGREPDTRLEVPLFGSGEIGERLLLELSE